MPRWRKLHTKAVESLDINDMPDDFTRLLWVMLPLGLDRAGRGLDNPSWVKAKIMPLRLDVSHEMVEAAMTWYDERGMIERYVVDGRRYFWVTSFARYQGNTSKEADSEYPPPPDDDTPDLPSTNSGPTPDLLSTNSGTDADADADADTDAEVDIEADADADAAPAAAPVTRPNAFVLFEQACGMLSPLIADEIKDRIEEFEKHRTGLPRGSPGADVDGDGWVGEAIREMARSGIERPNVRYVTAILDRWKRDGYQFGNNDRKGSGHATSGRGGGKRNGPVEEVVCATGLGQLISETEESERARDGPSDE